MSREALIAALVIAVLLAGLHVSAAKASAFEVVGTYWGTPSAPEDPEPGSHAHLTVQLRLSARTQARSLVAELRLEPPLYNATGGSTARSVLAQPVSPGSIISVSFLLQLPEDVKPGSYPAVLHLEWGSLTGTVSEDLSLSIDVRNSPKVEIGVSGSLLSGSPSNVTLFIRNIGDADARNLRVSVGGSSVVSPLSTVSLGSLAPGSSATITVKCLPQWSQRPYLTQLSVKAEYVDSYGRTRSVEKKLSVDVEPWSQKVDVAASPQLLNSSSRNSIKISIANRGPEDFLDAVLRLSPGQNLWPMVSIIRTGPMAPGSRKQVEVPIYVGGQQAATLQYSLTAYTELGEYTVQGQLSFSVVDAAVYRSVEVRSSSDVLVLGEKNELELIIEAPGGAYSAELVVQPQSGPIAILGSSHFWLGDIQPGDAVRVPLKVYVPVGAGKTTVLTAKLYYTDSGGHRTSSSRTLYFVNSGVVKLDLVDYSIVPSKPQPGQPFSITGTIINKGSSQASFVFVTPELENTPFSIVSRLSGYIGNAPVGTPVSFTIPLTVGSDAKPGSYVLALKASYVDELRRSGEAEFKVKIPVSETAPPIRLTQTPAGGAAQGEQIIYVAAGITAVVALLIGYELGRRRR